jgi:hypothetical protein
MSSKTVTFLGDRVAVTRVDGRVTVCTVLTIETCRRLFGVPPR